MSSVPKGKRKESKFEAQHHLVKLRHEITKFILNSCGFSEEKYEKILKRGEYILAHGGEKAIERYKNRHDEYNEWFIEKETEIIFHLLHSIVKYFTIANSIYPSNTPARYTEYCQRREFMNLAIGHCYTLRHELQYIINVLPVDINRFESLSDAINAQIALFKGVRRADNRFLKPDKNKKVDIEAWENDPAIQDSHKTITIEELENEQKINLLK